jgi:small subunit ribosomal protein S20
MAETKPTRTPQGQKRARQNVKRNLRNRAVMSEIKTLTKNVASAADAKDGEKTAEALRVAEKAISTAASKGVLHKNTASRKISRLTKGVNRALKTETA